MEEENIDPYKGNTEFIFYWKDNVRIDINKNIKIRIVDFGNAC